MNLDASLPGQFSFWDALAQLFFLAIIVLIVVLITVLLRSNNRRKNQLERIEQKIDVLNQRLEKDK